ncbi:MAG: hypothetical protein ACREK5_05900 [Gemmatimonadota bacterium]
MRGARGTRQPLLTALAGLALACGGGEPAIEPAPAADSLTDTLTSAEQQSFAVDIDRYHEMEGGRLDTVDMLVRGDDAAFQVQVLNYTNEYTALTYAAWYTGADNAVMFAADGQPRLKDEMGNVYRGIVIASNPRFEVASGTTAVGVYVFRPAVAPEADSLTLYVNDSTPPVLQIGPFGVRHDAGTGVPSGNLRMRAEEPPVTP